MKKRRRNPSSLVGTNVPATSIRPGDAIELEDLGRVHVIQGPYRSTRGIRFVDHYGRSLILRPNEKVRLRSRENPFPRLSVEPSNAKAFRLRHQVGFELDKMGLYGRSTTFRETKRGGLVVSRIDVYQLTRSAEAVRHLKRVAALQDFSFEVRAGSIVMEPLAYHDRSLVVHNPKPVTGTHAVAQRIVNAENAFIDFAMRTAGLTKSEAVSALRYMRKGGKRAPLQIDAVTGQFTFQHGAFAEPDVLRKAAKLGSSSR